VDRADDMRVFAKVVESGSFAGAAARLNIAASKLRHPVLSPPPLGAEASGCAQFAQSIGCAQPKPKILFTKAQESQ
jgi:Bacterial regulatory helix-turn-helix protein, lysR family